VRLINSRLIAVGTVALLTLAAPASAQNGFFGWFGGGNRPQQQQQQQNQNSWRQDNWFGQRQQQYAPPQGNAYSDPSNPSDRPVAYGGYGGAAPAQSTGTGRAVAFCVRTCDGRYFPMQRHANANSVELCSAFCPAAKTAVFNGSQIDHAMGANGARYADLANAFVYREKIVPGCTCNGKDAFGLVQIDVANDPTLRPGDVVSSGDNVKAALIAAAAAKERLPAQPPLNEKTAKRELPAGVKAITPAAPEAEPIPED
jgi:hypothetical protein